MSTLAEVLAHGRGTERPFRCEAHDDSHASASVNVIKMLWVCYACGASGAADGKAKPPPVSTLMSMLEPEKIPRVYPDEWLSLFSVNPGYWATRFDTRLLRYIGAGTDPFSGDPVYPVYTPSGLLAGVCRRQSNPEPGMPRYVYPYAWSAASSLGGWRRWPAKPPRVVVLVEGAADAWACWETGVWALACYGSGLHYPQRELLAQLGPKAILGGFDADEAGDLAYERTIEQVDFMAPMARIRWPAKDPADCSISQRLDPILAALSEAAPRLEAETTAEWKENITAYRSAVTQ